MKLLSGLRIAAFCAATFGVPRASFAQMHGMPGMPASPFGIPMDRMGSGTTWIPDAAPLPAKHFTLGNWDLMLHGFAFAQYNKQHGRRGDDQFGSLNWGMLMASHTLAGGRFQARTMLSLDPATVTDEGYPLLLQSGETLLGESIVDRQHPHDFFMELGVLYERALAGPVGFSLYAAPSGEPALGPVAFMHRPSGVEMPTAPLGHHWQDATHIAFGVVSAGLFTREWKVEGSWFNGREPNDERWDFDRITLDSYSARMTFNPGTRWSFAGGYGFLKSPEAAEPEESLHRITASVLHSAPFGMLGERATSIVWGANTDEGASTMTHSVLIESRLALDERNTVFGRVERVRKSAGDLAVDTPEFGFATDREFDVSSVSIGYVRELYRSRGVSVGLGGLATVNVLPSELNGAYGSRTPLGTVVFLRLRPVGAPRTMIH